MYAGNAQKKNMNIAGHVNDLLFCIWTIYFVKTCQNFGPLRAHFRNSIFMVLIAFRPADSVFDSGRLFHYLLDADLPLFRLAGEKIRGSIHPMGKLAPWRST
jgi:hypothetical protein